MFEGTEGATVSCNVFPLTTEDFADLLFIISFASTVNANVVFVFKFSIVILVFAVCAVKTSSTYIL